MQEMTQFEAERQECLRLKAQGLTRAEIAEKLDLTERQVKRRLAENANKPVKVDYHGSQTFDSVSGKPSPYQMVGGGTLDATPFIGSPFIGSIKDLYASQKDESLKVVDEYFGSVVDDSDYLDRMVKDKSLFDYEGADRQRRDIAEDVEDMFHRKAFKTLYMADLHIPFTDYKAVAKAIRDNQDAELLVINGDLLDLFAVSRFSKDKTLGLRRELEEGRDFLEYISKKFKKVVVTEGNHERRLKHYVKNEIPADIQFLFPQDILQMVVSGEVLKKDELENVDVVGSWWIKLFDTIYAHPDNYSSANLKTVQNTSEYFSLIEGIGHRQMVIGHTHRAGWLMQGETKLMETGCLCHNMDYHKGSKFVRTKWQKAYAVTETDNGGNADLNKSNIILL